MNETRAARTNPGRSRLERLRGESPVSCWTSTDKEQQSGKLTEVARKEAYANLRASTALSWGKPKRVSTLARLGARETYRKRNNTRKNLRRANRTKMYLLQGLQNAAGENRSESELANKAEHDLRNQGANGASFNHEHAERSLEPPRTNKSNGEDKPKEGDSEERKDGENVLAGQQRDEVNARQFQDCGELVRLRSVRDVHV
jgi:hypothetical protein